AGARRRRRGLRGPLHSSDGLGGCGGLGSGGGRRAKPFEGAGRGGALNQLLVGSRLDERKQLLVSWRRSLIDHDGELAQRRAVQPIRPQTSALTCTARRWASSP